MPIAAFRGATINRLLNREGVACYTIIRLGNVDLQLLFTRARREVSGVLYSQSALARSNSHPRATYSLVRYGARGVDGWVLLNVSSPNPVRSGRKQP